MIFYTSTIFQKKWTISYMDLFLILDRLQSESTQVGKVCITVYFTWLHESNVNIQRSLDLPKLEKTRSNCFL